MVRITPEVVENASQFTNAIKDRELDLRGYKFPAIENLGSTLDQFDTIDLSENEIRKVDGFPLLKRLKSLILTNNKIVRITDDLGQHLPNLNTLILTGNNLSELKELDPLSSCEKLEFLTLLNCPVTLRSNYRLYVISRISALRFLDYRRVTQSERKMARSLFKRLPALSASSVGNTKNAQTKINNALRSDLSNSTFKTFIPGAPLNASNLVPPGAEPARPNNETKENNMPDSNANQTGQSNSDVPISSASSDVPMPPPPSNRTTAGAKRPSGASTQDLFAIQEAIKRARTMDEVERLNQLLSSGQFAGFAAQWQKQLRQQQQQQQQQAPQKAA